MKTTTVAILASLLVFRLEADPPDYEAIRSKPSGDIMVEVWLQKQVGLNFSLSEPIIYNFLSITNGNCVIDLPKRAYLCQARMFDAEGNSLPLNRNYADIGRRFHELTYPSAEQPWSGDLKNLFTMKPIHSTGSSLGLGAPMKADCVLAEQAGGERRSLPCIDELFVVKKPGLYKVRLQFQVYTQTYKGGQSYAYKLERFEPVDFFVTKDKTQPASAH